MSNYEINSKPRSFPRNHPGEETPFRILSDNRPLSVRIVVGIGDFRCRKVRLSFLSPLHPRSWRFDVSVESMVITGGSFDGTRFTIALSELEDRRATSCRSESDQFGPAARANAQACSSACAFTRGSPLTRALSFAWFRGRNSTNPDGRKLATRRQASGVSWTRRR